MTDYKQGQNVWYESKHGWYVGQYQRTVERGKRFGMIEIHRNIPGYEETVYMEADKVSPIGYKGGL